MDTNVTQRPIITMDSVESSQIAAIGHHAESNTLAIRFPANRSGVSSVYHYRNFNIEQFAAFKAAASKGSYFGKHIKPHSDVFPYENVTELYAPTAAPSQNVEDGVELTDHFVEVPETVLRGSDVVVPAFLVGRYLASRDESGAVYISATDKPATHINFYDSRKVCREAGFELITNLQYLALAQNIAGVAENWTGGAVGEGRLYQGLRNWTVKQAQPNDYEPADPDERRWFVLSTGERVYDVAGHLFSWVVADVEGDPETGLVNQPFATGSPSITTAPHPSMENGVGWYPSAGADWSGYALVRGGCFDSRELAGLFRVDRDWPGDELVFVGFRCTKPTR